MDVLTSNIFISISDDPQKINQDLIKYKYNYWTIRDTIDIISFITYPTEGSWELVFLKSIEYYIQWDNIKHKSMKPLAFA